MLKFNHKRKHETPAGQVSRPAGAYRETADPLPGNFGKDKDRPLVVGLVNGDLISFRPKGTRQHTAVRAVDVYQFALMCKARNARIEKMNEAKERKARQRAARQIRYHDKKLSKGTSE